MPSSTIERKRHMLLWFGTLDDNGPAKFLVGRGYKITNDYEWLPPVSQHSPNFCEMECILFLIEEWDWGGIVRK